ncbi:MAG: hypothetical protein IJ054_06065 [Lachnospiraceae bacterium]|nr:hypothetical protein [Lachnospiraceae bacterium]
MNKKRYIIVVLLIIVFFVFFKYIFSNWNGKEEKKINGYETVSTNAEGFIYEKTESIVFPRNIEVNEGEIVEFTLPPIIVDKDRIDIKVETYNADSNITYAYKNEDYSITVAFTKEQLEYRINNMEFFINSFISNRSNLDIFISDDFKAVVYYIDNECSYLDFVDASVFTEQTLICAQVFSGVEYKLCYHKSKVVDRTTGELLFEYHCDSYDVYDFPSQNEWNEKLGLEKNY